MPYFQRVENYKTYYGQTFDFHFDYNANSGGGQAFLGGTYADERRVARQPKELEGRLAQLAFCYRNSNGDLRTIKLGTDAATVYPVSPRGAGSSQMKLGMTGKIRPSLVFPALLMLPQTCGVNMADALDVSPLTTGNYWLRSMWLDCLDEGDDLVTLVPKDYVFAGGSSKKGNNSSEGKVVGQTEFYLLDFNVRANDLIWAASQTKSFPEQITSPLTFLANTVMGNEPFSYEHCNAATHAVMRELARLYPEAYSGYSDPLPCVMAQLMKRRLCPSAVSEQKPKVISRPHNLIYFGAPGTGKSYSLNEAAKAFPEGNVRRVTFYPDYTYSQFVGCFKPMTEEELKEDGSVESIITYRYVFGPFLETYVKAVKNPDQNFLLIVEEINRANPAAVFGDVFQLLDRRADSSSEYAIAAPEEMRRQLTKELGESAEVTTIAIPSNMYIWATMNSADQGVFPMDTAFKRRWDFHYMGIDEGENAVVDDNGKKLYEITVPLDGKRVYWNELRKAINKLMMEQGHINEDKLLGPFFLNPSALTDERFAGAFKDKVLLYLFEDVGRTKRANLFWQSNTTYAQVCAEFDSGGSHVFSSDFDKSEIWANGNKAPSENQE